MKLFLLFTLFTAIFITSCAEVKFTKTDPAFKPAPSKKKGVIYREHPKKKYKIVGVIEVWGSRGNLEDILISKSENIGADGVIDVYKKTKIIINYSGYSEEYNKGGEHNVPITVPMLTGKAIVFYPE